MAIDTALVAPVTASIQLISEIANSSDWRVARMRKTRTGLVVCMIRFRAEDGQRRTAFVFARAPFERVTLDARC